MAQPAQATKNAALLREIAERAETRVQAQLATALAADQRAMVFAGLLAAATAALGGAGANVLTSSETPHFLGYVALSAAGGLLVAMALAVFAARPTSWFFPGSVPADWKEDVLKTKPEYDQLLELLADYDHRIASNSGTMLANGRLMMWSASIALATFAISGCIVVSHVGR